MADDKRFDKLTNKLKDTIENAKGDKYYAVENRAKSYASDVKKIVGKKETNAALQSDTKEAARERIKRSIKRDTKAVASQIGNAMNAALKAPGRIGAAVVQRVTGKDKGQSR